MTKKKTKKKKAAKKKAANKKANSKRARKVAKKQAKKKKTAKKATRKKTKKKAKKKPPEIEDVLGFYGARAYHYAHQVVEGETPACKWTRLACQRFIDDLHRDDVPWAYSPDHAEEVCQFIEGLRHIKGRWARLKERIKLEDWQCFIVCNLFGFVYRYDVYDQDTGDLIGIEGCRRFREAYIEVPRKNAKTTLAAAIALYMLAKDGEAGAEVYTAATSREQAKICFGIAREMAIKAPEVLPGIGIRANHLNDIENGSIFKPLHAQGSALDGLSVHLSVNDELHAWNNKKREVWNVIETACGSRDQSMMLSITTAGSDVDGVCYEKHCYTRETLEAQPEDRNDFFFCIIWSIDEGDDWKDRDIWIKANPNYGVSVSPLDMMALAKKAEKLPSERFTFQTKRLNLWLTSAANWMDMELWDKCGDPELMLEHFEGEECVLGNDHASKRDITAQAVVFRRMIEGKPNLYAFLNYYLPERAVERSVQQYGGWVRRGLIKTTPGAMINVDYVEQDTKELADRFPVREIAVDPGHNTTQYAAHMEEEGFEVIDVRPSALNFSEPMKWLEAYVAEGRFHFNGDPVLTWMVSNVVVKPDFKDNIFPRKERDANKIDGVIALLMAINRIMVGDDGSSVYDERGVLSL